MEISDKKSSMFYGASPIIFELAKKLRNNVTATEMILWGNLKSRFPSMKFRRQHPISIYIADFYCHNAKLIIEIDGSIHSLPEIRENDIERQKNLESLGLKIIRFTNKEVLNNLQEVITIIEKNIKSF